MKPHFRFIFDKVKRTIVLHICTRHLATTAGSSLPLDNMDTDWIHNPLQNTQADRNEHHFRRGLESTIMPQEKLTGKELIAARENIQKDEQPVKDAIQNVAGLRTLQQAVAAPKSHVSAATLSEIESALKAYGDAVLASDLSATSQRIYLDHATNFVRWIKGEFQPGAYRNAYALKRKKDVVVHGFNSAPE